MKSNTASLASDWFLNFLRSISSVSNVAKKLSTLPILAFHSMSLAFVRVFEVPVIYNSRTYAEGKKIRAKDGILALIALIRFRFRLSTL